MDRRNFLGLFTEAAVSAGLGIAPADTADNSFRPYAVRYLEDFDLYFGEMVHRIDITNGFALAVPKNIERAVAYKQVGYHQINQVLTEMSKHVGPAMSIAIVSSLMRQLPGPGQIIGVSW